MCTPIGCPIEFKPTEFPIQCNASDYIKCKKDQTMTLKYTKGGYPTTYPQYAFRNEIRSGRTWRDVQCATSCVDGKIPSCGKWYVCNPKSNALVI